MNDNVIAIHEMDGDLLNLQGDKAGFLLGEAAITIADIEWPEVPSGKVVRVTVSVEDPTSI